MQTDEIVESQMSGAVGALIVIICVFINTAFGNFKKIFSYVHESFFSIAFGCTVGLISLLLGRPWFLVLNGEEFSRLVFVVMLPIVVLHAGLTCEKRHFFDNIGSIAVLAVVGTMANALVISFGVWELVDFRVWDANLLDCLMFGSLLSATDTVSTLATLRELRVDPMLHCLVLFAPFLVFKFSNSDKSGESMFNDVASIALMSTLTQTSNTNLSALPLLFHISRDFVFQTIVSLFIGIFMGLTSALSLRGLLLLRKRFHNQSRIGSEHEMTIVLLSCYASYAISQGLSLSGIISLLVCSMSVSHYHFKSLKRGSRLTIISTVSTMAYFAETAVFTSIGLALVSQQDSWDDWNFTLCFSSIGLILIARAIAVFGLTTLLNLGRDGNEAISLKYSAIIWMANQRGAIAVILALNLPNSIKSKQMIINSTYAASLFTNGVLSPLTRPLAWALGISGKPSDSSCQGCRTSATTPVILQEEEDPLSASLFRRASAISIPPLTTETTSASGVHGPPHYTEIISPQGWFHTWWSSFDTKYMKPIFGDFP